MRADVDATSLVGPATGDEEEGQQEEDVGVNMADPVALKRMLQDVNVARVAAQQQVRPSVCTRKRFMYQLSLLV
jgi:hypothetical protein